MPRKSKGYSAHPHRNNGKWYGRIRLKKPDGSTKYYTRQARNKTHAKQIADELEQKYVTGGIEALDAEDMTFGDLAEHYKRVKVIDAVFDGDIKVAGMMPAGKESAEKEIKGLLEYWSIKPIQNITHADLEEYKIEMLKKPVTYRWWEGGELVEKQRDEPRKMASVNHLLRRLKAMLNFAKRKGWLRDNPFNRGESLISEAAEVPRNRAEREKELGKLLAACVGRREYLRPFILIMTDSALRLTEAKRLTRSEINFKRKFAMIKARNTKGNKPRIVPLSDRLLAELRNWCDKAKDDNTPILQQTNHKSAWKTLKEKAGISDDLQLRDLRGWGTTRIVNALEADRIPTEFGMKITGHTQRKTYERYIKTDEEVARRVGEALKNFDDKAA
jgi:integrase